MRTFALVFCFSLVLLPNVVFSSTNSGSMNYPYRPQFIEGIYEGENITNLTFEEPMQKPRYNGWVALSQYAIGGIGGMAGGAVGLISGIALYRLSGGESNDWGAIGAGAIGAFVGFGLTRPLVIHAVGNRQGYKGSYMLTLGAYSVSMLVMLSALRPTTTTVLFADLISTMLASIVHHHSLKPEVKKKALTIVPTVLPTHERSFAGGLTMNYTF